MGSSISEDERAFRYCDDQNIDEAQVGGGCRIHEFCGRDKRCHSIGCDNLYRYGPDSIVGVKEEDWEDNDTELTCTFNDEVDGVAMENDTSGTSYGICEGDEWPVAMGYSCSPGNLWVGWSSLGIACTQKAEPRKRTLPFARRCEGQPNPHQVFLCYDMKEVILSDYTGDYMKLATDGNCTMTARHEITNRVVGNSYSTNLYPRRVYEDALEAVDNALYSRLFGWHKQESLDSEDSSGSEDISGCGPWSLITPLFTLIVVACLVLSPEVWAI